MEERDSSLAAFIEMLDTELPGEAAPARWLDQPTKDLRLGPVGRQGLRRVQPGTAATAEEPQADWH